MVADKNKNYTVLEQTQNTITKFEVTTRVVGPVNYCGGYSEYTCSTIIKKDISWQAAYSECDEGNLWEE